MPVKFTSTFTGFKVNGAFTKRLDRDLGRLLRQAVREWLRTLFAGVAQWSGETAGSIAFAQGADGNINRFLNVFLPVAPPHPRPNKNPQTGSPQGQYDFTIKPGHYEFTYESDVPQFFLNEFFVNVSPTSPWGATLAAEQAFEEYINNNLERFLPKLDEFIVEIGDSEDDVRIVTLP